MNNPEELVRIIYKNNKFYCNRKNVKIPVTIENLLIGKGEKSSTFIRRKHIL